MDPSTPLDYALFHLTPTRTRCDLLVFSGGGGRGEKIASGLLEPFLSHLRCARDQIHKGGYSITLLPAAAHTPWFTKATLERFVRFVSSPEILERLISIEREISQIEVSIHSGAATSGLIRGDHQTDQGNLLRAIPEDVNTAKNAPTYDDGESSKFCLQRVLETRKAMLQKEQGMAYARASVAGFELPHIDKLLLFSDSFGASRLREACLNFKSLCKKKEKDKLWMDELAAMEACSHPEPSIGTSGIMLTCESTYGLSDTPVVHEVTNQLDLNVSLDEASPYIADNPPCSNLNQEKLPRQESILAVASDAFNEKPLAPNAWRNHSPHYFYGYRSPISQDTPPNQGYAFPGMPVVSPYHLGYHRNMQSPPEEFDYAFPQETHHHNRHGRSSRSNKRSLSREALRCKETTMGSEDADFDQRSSNSGSESHEGLYLEVPSGKGEQISEDTQKRSSKKKSSRTVVIRNINYISSKRQDGGKAGSSDESLVEDHLLHEDFLKNKLENVVNSLQKHRKSTQRRCDKRVSVSNPDSSSDPIDSCSVKKSCDIEKNDDSWQSFQNILLKDEELASNKLKHDDTRGIVKYNMENGLKGGEYCIVKSTKLNPESLPSGALDVQSEKEKIKQLVTAEPITITERDANVGDLCHMENFEYDENYCSSIKRSHAMNEDFFYMQRTETAADIQVALSDYTDEQSVRMVQTGGDWTVAQSDKLLEQQQSSEFFIINGNKELTIAPGQQSKLGKNDKQLLIDDSFMVPIRSTVDEQPISQLETDMNILSGTIFPSSGKTYIAQEMSETLCFSEPSDLHMVLERDSPCGSFGISWSPEVGYDAQITFTKINECKSGAGTYVCTDHSKPSNCKEGTLNGNTEKIPLSMDSSGETFRGSLVKSKSDVLSKNRKPPTISRSTLQKEKMEKEQENRKRIEELLLERKKRISQRSARHSTSSTPTAASRETNTQRKATTASLNHDKTRFQSATQVTDRLKLNRKESPKLTKDKQMTGPSKRNGITCVVRATQPESFNMNGDSARANGIPEKITAINAKPSNSGNEHHLIDRAAYASLKEGSGPTHEKLVVSMCPDKEQASIMNPEVLSSYSRKKWTRNGDPAAEEGIKKLLFGQRIHNSIPIV